MPLGWCTKCDRLKAITPLGLKLGSRECDWAPVEHNEPDRHVECTGTITWSEVNNEDYTGPHWASTCSVCGEVPEGEVVTNDKRCDGSRKPIR